MNEVDQFISIMKNIIEGEKCFSVFKYVGSMLTFDFYPKVYPISRKKVYSEAYYEFRRSKPVYYGPPRPSGECNFGVWGNDWEVYQNGELRLDNYSDELNSMIVTQYFSESVVTKIELVDD